MNRIREAIELAAQGDAAGFRKLIQAELFARAAEEIDARRVVVAQEMFLLPEEASDEHLKKYAGIETAKGVHTPEKPVPGMSKAPKRRADGENPGNPKLTEGFDIAEAIALIAEQYGVDPEEIVEQLAADGVSLDDDLLIDEGIFQHVARAAAKGRSVVGAFKHAVKNAARSYVPGSVAAKVRKAGKGKEASGKPNKEQIAAGRKGWKGSFQTRKDGSKFWRGGNEKARANRMDVRADLNKKHSETEEEVNKLRASRAAEIKSAAEKAGLDKGKDGKSRFRPKGTKPENKPSVPPSGGLNQAAKQAVGQYQQNNTPKADNDSGKRDWSEEDRKAAQKRGNEHMVRHFQQVPKDPPANYGRSPDHWKAERHATANAIRDFYHQNPSAQDGDHEKPEHRSAFGGHYQRNLEQQKKVHGL